MELFPAGLAQTLFPAILLGVLVTFVATETLGWTFTGLVVPGYLASVALVSPRAALLMVIEALASLVVARLLSDGAARMGVASRFFGRERFFLLLAVATLIRLGIEHALHRAGMGTGDLAAHSIGLVLVPLMAHTLDKVGMGRGLGQLGALTLVTGALVALLVRFTNLSLSDLSLTFEDVAFSIDRSPKAYVVLLAGALLAARANVAFGWDFHGIIVPGLLAVAWFEPTKVLLTLLEAAAALVLALGLLRLPLLRRMALEGPRRLVFVFIADAILRMSVVGLLGSDSAFIRASDLYGFGYLLPTLLAVKIWQRGSLWRVTLPAAQVSLGGFLAGNALFLLLGAAANWLAPAPAAAAPAVAEPQPFARAILDGRALVAHADVKDALSAAEMEIWSKAIGALADGSPPAVAVRPLAALGLQVAPLTPEAGHAGGVAVHERVSKLNALRGLGTFVARAEGRPLVVAVPHPLDGDAAIAAIDVAEALGARLVAVAGRPEASDLERLGVPTTPLHRSPWALAHYLLSERGWAWLALDVDEAAPAGGELRLRPGKVPNALDLATLKRLLPDLRVTWSREAETVLVAPAASWRRLAARPCADLARVPSALATRQLVGDAAGADELDVAEQLLFARDVVAPLARGEIDGSACRIAAVLGLSVVTTVDADGARHAAVLPAERRAATVVVRLDKKGGALITAPHPELEPYGRRAAVALYEALPARALLLGSENPAEVSSYDAAGEALASVFGPALSVVEVRGAGHPALAEGAVITWGAPAGSPARIPAWLEPIREAAARAGLAVRPWDGSPDEACCGDLGSPWQRRLARLGRDRHASIYLSTPLRERRFGPSGVEAVVAQAIGLGIARLDGTLPAALSVPAHGSPDARTFALLRRYAELRHAGDLAALAKRPGVRLVTDGVTGEAYLVYAAGRAVGAVNLRDPGSAAEPTLELRGAGPVPAETVAKLRNGGLTALWRAP